MGEIGELPPPYRIPPTRPATGGGAGNRAPKRKPATGERQPDRRDPRRKHDDNSHVDEYA